MRRTARPPGLTCWLEFCPIFKKYGLFIFILFITVGCVPERDVEEVWRTVFRPEHQMNPDRLIPPDELNEDIDFFVRTLEEVHPDPYYRISKEKFYQNVKALKERIVEPQTRREFFVSFAPLVKSIRDGHTDVIRPRGELDRYKKTGGTFFPLAVEVEGSKLFVAHDLTGRNNRISAGREIRAVNGVSADSLVESLRLRISGTPPLVTDKLEDSFPTDLYFVHGFEGPFEVKIGDADYTLNGLPWDTLQARKNRTRIQQPDTDLSYKRLDSHTGLMTVNSFAVKMDTFTAFVKDSFLQIQRDSIKHLIIDVRHNGGGDSDLADSLVTYITNKPFKSIHRTDWKRSHQYEEHLKAHAPSWMQWLPLSYFYPDKNYTGEYRETPIGENLTIYHEEKTPSQSPLRFEGDVYVLSGVRTFSSAVIFLTIIKDYDLATIVGEETGGPANHFGELYPFVLPNSKLWMHTSVKRFIRPSGEDNSGGVKPDIIVRQTQKDTNDTVLEKVKEFINSTN